MSDGLARCLTLLVVALVAGSCGKDKMLFDAIPSELTGIDFTNTITEYDSFNIISYEYIYNGGGVGVGDFNNDGLQDLFFTGNMVPNKLYLNLGNFKFRDVSAEANIGGEGKWCSGVAVADINGDGLKDIYVTATAHPDPRKRENIMYINKGVGKNATPVFENLAHTYGVNDTTYTTSAAFFDYDNDGDLDLFLIANKMTDGKTANVYRNRAKSTDRVDRLYRNDWNSTVNHPVFTDVSEQSGIIYEGYSLGVNVTDVNKDGWNDVYITNDFLSNDLLYINKGDGTFIDVAPQVFRHTSHSAMGNDVVDVNNDGLPDIIAVDMLPEDNFRKKTMLGPNNYVNYINNEKYGIQHQYIRNTLQLNLGLDNSTRLPLFGDVALMAGISSTDWSWTPLVADFDQDGFRDIIITNGFPKDVTDRDFIEFHSEIKNYASYSFLSRHLPSVKISNYAYRNTGGFVFEDVSAKWGILKSSFSNGAVYVDLDNDGDLDYVVNNINDRASVYRNNVVQNSGQTKHWINIKFKGTKLNPDAFGTKVTAYVSGKIYYADHSPFRGYLSSVENGVHFGLGAATRIDSIHVVWPDQSATRLVNVEVDQRIVIEWTKALEGQPFRSSANSQYQPLFIEEANAFDYVHQERDFIDFNIQPLLLRKLSQYGPGVAVGDVNNDGLEDLYISGSRGHQGTFFVQDRSGRFEARDLFHTASAPGIEEELGVLFFDADNDGDLDLYVVSGGYETDISDDGYRDALYENRNGVFHKSINALPEILASGSCVRAADFDRDGDLDLFVGGRVLPHKYPVAVSSYILRNDSKAGELKFTQVNDTNAPQLNELGLVCDALWSDFNGDGWVDLVIAGEWAPLYFFMNRNGVLENVTANTGINDKHGLWNSIAGADFDGDGDIDYVVGNLGLNTLVRGSAEEPFQLYYGDFDKNGNLDFIPTSFLKNEKGGRSEFPFFGRLDMQKELIQTKRMFLKHAAFGRATIKEVLTEDQLLNATVLTGNYFQSAMFRNLGNGRFNIEPLPAEAQISIINGMITGDFNGDGYADVIAVGNDFGTELLVGRMDAFHSLLLLGDGSGGFTAANMQTSGLSVRGDAKALVSWRDSKGTLMVAATQNRGGVALYSGTPCDRVFRLPENVLRAEVVLDNGKVTVSENYCGSGFLSQSAATLCIPDNAVSIRLTSFQGEVSEKRFDQNHK
jgi:enediyne biosynthesis protein E4